MQKTRAAQRRRKHMASTCSKAVVVALIISGTTVAYRSKVKEVSSLRADVASMTQQYETLAAEHETLTAEHEKVKQKLAGYTEPVGDIVPAPPIYNVPLSADIQTYLYTKCVDYDITKYYETILAQIWKESNFNPKAISPTNDYGLMQINECMHATLRDKLGIVDFLEPYQSIDAGTYMMSNLIHTYGDIHKALMAYNFGPGGASAHWKKGTYTSSYSRDIVDKRDIIVSGNYKQHEPVFGYFIEKIRYI